MQYTLLTRGRIQNLRDILDPMGYELIAAQFVVDFGLVLIIMERSLIRESFLIREKDIIKKNILGAKKIKFVDLRSADIDIIECLEESDTESVEELVEDVSDAVRYMLERKRTDEI